MGGGIRAKGNPAAGSGLGPIRVEGAYGEGTGGSSLDGAVVADNLLQDRAEQDVDTGGGDAGHDASDGGAVLAERKKC